MTSKPRSPQYPSISLPDAIKMARAIYASIGTERVDFNKVLNAIGFNKSSGKALTTLSSLRKYGLIIKKDNQYKLSDTGKNIAILPEDSEDYKNAALRAADRVDLFNEIDRGYNENRKFDLHNWLISREFTEDAARNVGKIYFERNRFISDKLGIDLEGRPKQMRYILKAEPGIFSMTGSASKISIERKEIITLEEGDVVISFPDPISRTSADHLRKALELFIAKIESRSILDR